LRTLEPIRRFMNVINMAAVPKSAPAVIPSKRAIFLFFFDRLSATARILSDFAPMFDFLALNNYRNSNNTFESKIEGR